MENYGDYRDYAADAASLQAYNNGDEDSLASVETLPDKTGQTDFASFAHEFPEKFFALAEALRPDQFELLVEYYVIGKSQSFLAKCRKQIQARAFESLKLIEQAMGAMILLGTRPDVETLQPILEKEGLAQTEYGPLAAMIVAYADCRNYSTIADAVNAPVPAIRKIFRPAAQQLLNSDNLRAVAVGAYLGVLMEHASLRGSGYGKRYLKRMKRIQSRRFVAPPLDCSPLFSYGKVESLKDAPWCMFEISAENTTTKVFSAIRSQASRLFHKKPVQVFAPTDKEGNLMFGFVFARGTSVSAVRALTRIRGISEMSATHAEDGTFLSAVTVPNCDIQKLVDKYVDPRIKQPRTGDFVRVLSGEVAGYCGTMTNANTVIVNFPTGRRFVVNVDASSVKVLDVPKTKQAFWGRKA